MKKHLIFIAVLFMCGIFLMACSDDDNNINADNNDNTEENSTQNNNDQGTDENNNDAQNENDSSNDNDNMDDNDNSGSSDAFEPEAEDQEGLGIGDTGTFDTTLGSYEMTLDAAELVGSELDGEQTQLADLILLDLTIKNTGDEPLKIEDLMESMHVGDNEDGGGYYDAAEYFDSIEEFTGELDPGEEKSGQFIADANTSDTYFFKKDEGNITAGSSNQVIWEFEAEEE